MDGFRIKTKILSPLGAEGRSFLSSFLSELELDLEDDIDLSVIVSDGDTPVAVASLARDVIKCVGVRPGYEGEGAAARAVSVVVAEAQARGLRRLFVYTSPGKTAIFESLGFSLLATVEPSPLGEGAALLENDPRAFGSWADGIARLLPNARASGAVVVNCNPFTRGHRSLIERASADCSKAGGPLLVLVLAGERSSFPSAVRERLVRAGTADLANVVVASAGPYCVSGATFPAYYLREKGLAAELQAKLDAELFASRIAPTLGIQRRFVGEEPYCQVTAAYNRALAERLPRGGIELVELRRIDYGGIAISASTVRQALRNDDWELVEALVPKTTLDWLRSREASPVLEALRTGSGRH